MKVVRRDDDCGAALDEMADDDRGMLDDRGGALDYEQYYPTLLPLQAPDAERAAMLADAPGPQAAEAEVG